MLVRLPRPDHGLRAGVDLPADRQVRSGGSSTLQWLSLRRKSRPGRPTIAQRFIAGTTISSQGKAP